MTSENIYINNIFIGNAMVWSAKVFVVDSVTITSYYFRIPVMEWLCGKSGIPCSQLCFYLDCFTGTGGTFLDKCGILRTGRMADFKQYIDMCYKT